MEIICRNATVVYVLVYCEEVCLKAWEWEAAHIMWWSVFIDFECIIQNTKLTLYIYGRQCLYRQLKDDVI